MKRLEDIYNSEFTFEDRSIRFEHRAMASVRCVFSIRRNWKWLYWKWVRRIFRPSITVALKHSGEPDRTRELFPGDEYTMRHFYNASGIVLRPHEPGLKLSGTCFPLALDFDGDHYHVERDGRRLIMKEGW